jgi:hypothetical protein
VIFHQTQAKLRQERKIEPRIRQCQAQCILPINPFTDRISRLSIRETIDILEDGDDSQSPRLVGMLTFDGVEGNKVLILIDGP